MNPCQSRPRYVTPRRHPGEQIENFLRGLDSSGACFSESETTQCLDAPGNLVGYSASVLCFVIKSHEGTDLTQPIVGQIVSRLKLQDVVEVTVSRRFVTGTKERHGHPRLKEDSCW